MIRDKQLAARVILGSIIGLLLTVLVNTAHCTTTSSRKNSLGTVSYTSNPYIYLAGSLVARPDAVANIDGNLSLRINPLETYMLYDEPLLLCGLPIDKFNGVSEPFVLTYERQAHKTVQGIGCHELISVEHVALKKQVQ